MSVYTIEHHKEFYLDSGDFFMLVENVMFKIHLQKLAFHCKPIREMISHPASIKEGEVEEAPFVQSLPENTSFRAFELFIMIIYDMPIDQFRPRVPLNTLTQLLAFSQFYQCERGQKVSIQVIRDSRFFHEATEVLLTGWHYGFADLFKFAMKKLILDFFAEVEGEAAWIRLHAVGPVVLHALFELRETSENFHRIVAAEPPLVDHCDECEGSEAQTRCQKDWEQAWANGIARQLNDGRFPQRWDIAFERFETQMKFGGMTPECTRRMLMRVREGDAMDKVEVHIEQALDRLILKLDRFPTA